MSAEWLQLPLGDVIALQRGHDLPSQHRKDGVVPVMGSSGLTGFHDQYKASGQGVVIGRSGNSMGEVSFCPIDYWPLNTALYVTDFKGNDERFIYYLLTTINFDQFNSGSAQKSLNRNAVYPYEVRIPKSIEEQKRISSVLAGFEEKLELNTQINQTLEQMAQAIFKSWFVGFEPVKAKIAARKRWQALQPGNEPASPVCYAEELADIDLETSMNLAAMQAISGKDQAALARMEAEQPEQYAELHRTAELFPSAMQDSELGEIPEGWEVALSGKVIDIRDGTHDSPKKAETGHPLVTSKHITSGILKLNDAYLISKSDFEKVNQRSKVDHGDILLTMIGTVGVPYLVSLQDGDFAIKNVGLFKTSKATELSGFFYLLLKSDYMNSYLDARIAGTTQKYLSLKTLRSIEFVLPPSQVLATFSKLTHSFFGVIQENSEQTKTLSSFRDNLLPKLLSGELDVTKLSEAEELPA